MNHQLTHNLELEVLLTGPELLVMLTGHGHLSGDFGDGVYRFEELATHGWQLLDAELTNDLADDALVRLVMVRADLEETGGRGPTT